MSGRNRSFQQPEIEWLWLECINLVSGVDSARENRRCVSDISSDVENMAAPEQFGPAFR